MKLWTTMLVGAFCASLLASCSRKTTAGTPLAGPPTLGATYSLNDGEGGFRLAKILVVEEGVVFVSLYGDRWTARPARTQVARAKDPLPVAFSPESFAGLQPVHVEDGAVAAEDLEAYETWKRSQQAPF